MAIAATALAAVAPAHAQTTGGLEDFRLPPSTPDIQGPVTPDNPIVERPLPRTQTTPPPRVELPAPKPAEPAPATPKPAQPAARPDSPRPAAPSRTEPTARETQAPPATRAPTGSQAETGQAESPAAPAAPAPTVEAIPTPAAPPAIAETPAPATAAERAAPVAADTASGTPWWRYFVIILLLIPMGIAGFLFWRQRHGRIEHVAVMPIERPKPRAVPAQEEPATPEIPAPALALDEPEEEVPVGPLRHALETNSLSVSLVNATLSYQLTLTNTSRQMIRNVAIYGDLVSAHASLSVEEQLAGPLGVNAPLHQIPALLPGQSTFLNGQLRLPISAIRPLRRDQAVLFVPLARMRIEAEGLADAVVQTCVVGQKPAGPGAGLRPFRLDTGPRVYAEIGQRTLDVPTPQAA